MREESGMMWRSASAGLLIAAAAVAVLLIGPTDGQPLRPWSPTHHVRDPHHSDENGRLAMVDLDSMKEIPEEDRPDPIPGVVLWSMTCTGSAAYAQTLLDWSRASKLRLAPLCGSNEYFFKEVPTRKSVYRCLRQHPEGKAFFTHLYPGNLQSDSDLQKPYDILKVLREQGASVLLVVYRENWLARLVSSAEILLSHHAPTRVHGTSKRKQAFYDFFRGFSEDSQPVSFEFLRKMANNAQKAVKGDEAGQSLGYRVVKASYRRNGWPCPAVKEAFEVMLEEHLIERMPQSTCVAVQTKTTAPKKGMAIDERVGPQAAQLLRDNLKGSKYEWMLDLDSEDPPMEQQRPTGDFFVRQEDSGGGDI